MATKTTKKTITKNTAVKPAHTVEHKCECGADCPCHKHGTAHWVKHIIVWAIIFALGMVFGQMINCGGNHHKKMPMKQPVFVEGCLDMQSVECPKMREALEKADADADNCISREEYKAVKQTIMPKKFNKKSGKQMKKGSKGPRGPRAGNKPSKPETQFAK